MSIFLPNKKPLLTFLLQEALRAVIQSDPQITLEGALAAAHVMVGMKIPSQSEMLALTDRLKPKAPVDEKKQPTSSRPGMCKELLGWMEKLPTDEMCLLVCGYDVERARKLYCETDIDTAEVAFGLYLDQTWQQFRAHYETSLYGFGGNLGEDPEIPVTVVDMTDNDQVMDMFSQFKSLGF